MLNFILNGILWTLALYGLFEIIKNIIYICTYTNLKSDGIYIIIAAKNQENKIVGAGAEDGRHRFLWPRR